jgi:hypothetical protein
MITVTGIQCLRCRTILVSRADHDYRTCPCGAVSVDGGRAYLRVRGNPEDVRDVTIDLPLEVERDLFRDYINGKGQHGLYLPDTHSNLNVRDATPEGTR